LYSTIGRSRSGGSFAFSSWLVFYEKRKEKSNFFSFFLSKFTRSLAPSVLPRELLDENRDSVNYLPLALPQIFFRTLFAETKNDDNQHSDFELHQDVMRRVGGCFFSIFNSFFFHLSLIFLFLCYYLFESDIMSSNLRKLMSSDLLNSIHVFLNPYSFLGNFISSLESNVFYL